MTVPDALLDVLERRGAFPRDSMRPGARCFNFRNMQTDEEAAAAEELVRLGLFEAHWKHGYRLTNEGWETVVSRRGWRDFVAGGPDWVLTGVDGDQEVGRLIKGPKRGWLLPGGGSARRLHRALERLLAHLDLR